MAFDKETWLQQSYKSFTAAQGHDKRWLHGLASKHNRTVKRESFQLTQINTCVLVPDPPLLFKDESIPVRCCRTSTDNHIKDFLHDQLKLGAPEGVFFTALPITLQCADSPDLCSHVSKHDSSALEKQGGQLNSKHRKKTCKGSNNKEPENAGVQVKIDRRVEMSKFIPILSEEDKGETQRLKQEEKVRMRKRKGMGGHTVFRELTSE